MYPLTLCCTHRNQDNHGNEQMTSEQILTLAMQRRTEQGFRLEWFIPSEGRSFAAYAKDEAVKQTWLAKAEANGWMLM